MNVKCLIFAFFYGLMTWNLIFSIVITLGLAFSMLDNYLEFVKMYFVFECAFLMLLAQIYFNCLEFTKRKI